MRQVFGFPLPNLVLIRPEYFRLRLEIECRMKNSKNKDIWYEALGYIWIPNKIQL